MLTSQMSCFIEQSLTAELKVQNKTGEHINAQQPQNVHICLGTLYTEQTVESFFFCRKCIFLSPFPIREQVILGNLHVYGYGGH